MRTPVDVTRFGKALAFAHRGWPACRRADGQARTSSSSGRAANPFKAPSTPWGDPDLQGIWNFGTITPLERPAQFKDRATLTPEEVARLNEDEARPR